MPDEAQTDAWLARYRQTDITLMIEDSNDLMADKYYDLNGDAASIQRLISTCGLKNTSLGQSWSFTQMTPADAARYGKCIGDGTAAGATWTLGCWTKCGTYAGQ